MDADAAQQKTALVLPKDFGRFTGDWDAIVKRGTLRVLVVYSKGGFYYDKGRPRGANVDAMTEFENIINKKLKTGAKKFKVVYVSLPPGELLQSLNDGVGDLICSAIVVTPEREKLVDFSIPLANGVKLVVVSRKGSNSFNSLDDLSGREIYVSPISAAKQELDKLNQQFKQAGKREIEIKPVDANLTEDDMLEMVNAGLLPATVSASYRAEMWSHVFPNLALSPFAVKDQGEVAWAMRRGSPQLKGVVDDFLKDHRIGTTFGNMMLNRYIKNAKALKNSTSEAEMQKFKTLVKYFQQYAAEYNFDFLMIAAQAYQESMLNQNRVSPRGAVGVMQVLPKYAAADPINIQNVRDVSNNIHAGTKMLAQITKTYFNDPAIDPVNKTMFTFAAYNAGPNRIVRLRKVAEKQGLDPNKWFGNVELVAAQDIGQETVQYVSNIYKYYVAYKMSLDQIRLREQAKERLKGN
jgi:membrane-bound lytic murein transglycosylase MltF